VSVKPLGGYQYVWLHGEQADAPEAIWLKGDVACPAFVNASKSFSQSAEYAALFASTKAFYASFAPLLTNAYTSPSDLTFANAYSIFDVLNVESIHNASIANSLTSDQLFQLRTLADAHEYALTFNASQPQRSIPGQTFIGKVLTQLNQTITTPAGPKFSLLVGSYNTFQAFFGLANLTDDSPNFVGIPDYASTMTFEVVTNATVGAALPDPSDISVRFLFRNGSAADAPYQAFPIFGMTTELMPWTDFEAKMSALQVSTAAQWCSICGGAQEPFCATSAAATTSPAPAVRTAMSVMISTPVAGVIGAMVTLGVVGMAVVVAGLLGARVTRRRARTASGPMMAGAGYVKGASDAGSA